MLGKMNFQTTTDYQKIAGAEVVFICVGTPSSDDGSMVLEYITNAAGQLVDVLRKKDDYCIVALKSTVVPGTTEELVIPILEESGRKAGRDFEVRMDREFLQEGKGVYNYMNPARIVIGQLDASCGDTLVNLYKDFKAPVMRTSSGSAVMIKLASNSFHAAKVSLINEI